MIVVKKETPPVGLLKYTIVNGIQKLVVYIEKPEDNKRNLSINLYINDTDYATLVTTNPVAVNHFYRWICSPIDDNVNLVDVFSNLLSPKEKVLNLNDNVEIVHNGEVLMWDNSIEDTPSNIVAFCAKNKIDTVIHKNTSMQYCYELCKRLEEFLIKSVVHELPLGKPMVDKNLVTCIGY